MIGKVTKIIGLSPKRLYILLLIINIVFLRIFSFDCLLFESNILFLVPFMIITIIFIQLNIYFEIRGQTQRSDSTLLFRTSDKLLYNLIEKIEQNFCENKIFHQNYWFESNPSL